MLARARFDAMLFGSVASFGLNTLCRLHMSRIYSATKYMSLTSVAVATTAEMISNLVTDDLAPLTTQSSAFPATKSRQPGATHLGSR